MMFDDGLLYMGKGQIILSSGFWRFDLFHGEGLFILPCGGLYYGFFEKNILNGPGVLFLHNQRLIVTQFLEGLMDGVCFELNIPYNVWMISIYDRGKFVKYENDFKLNEERKNYFGNA